MDVFIGDMYMYKKGKQIQWFIAHRGCVLVYCSGIKALYLRDSKLISEM